MTQNRTAKLAARVLVAFGLDRSWFKYLYDKRVQAGDAEGLWAQYVAPEHIMSPGSDVEAWWIPRSPTDKTSYAGEGAVFAGKSNKPVEHYMYKSKDQFLKAVDTAATVRQQQIKARLEELRKRKEYKHDYVVGDILYASWGYDETRVDWYEVTKIPAPKTVELREIGSRVVKDNGPQVYVVATPGRFSGPPISRRPSQGGGVRIDDVRSAYKWDGKPKYQTGANWGH